MNEVNARAGQWLWAVVEDTPAGRLSGRTIVKARRGIGDV
jgi:hypothetical protein